MPKAKSKHSRSHSNGDLHLSVNSPLTPHTSSKVPGEGGGTKKRKHDDHMMDDDPVGNAIAELHVIVDGQRAQIKELRTTVHRQQECINALMSMLGVPLMSASGTEVQASPPSSSSSGPPGASSGAASSLVTPGDTVSTHSYAGVVRDVPTLSAPLRQAVATAVYRDVKEHERRARNIVLNGVPPVNGRDDAQTVSALLEREFGTRPDMIRCRRLGKPQPAKIQPVLVVLRSDDAADYYINRAKLLRQSTDEQTSRSVFINRDETRAEAQASYVARCERRRRAADRANRMLGAAAVSTASHPPIADLAASSSSSVSMMNVDPSPLPSTLTSSSAVGATAEQTAAATSASNSVAIGQLSVAHTNSD